jgi:hypothetical protein
MTLSEEQRESYRQKGYLKLEHVFDSEEIDAWDAESKRLLKVGFGKDDNSRLVMYRTPIGLSVIDRINPVIDISPVFRAVVEDQRIRGPLRELYEDEMILFKDKIIYKMPGVPGYNMHQDYSFWQRFPLDLANVIVSIDGADAYNGGVEFFPGHHDRLLSTPGERRNMNNDEAAQIDLCSGEVIETGAGDMVIFDSMTPHRSGINRSNRLRRQLYLTYSSARNGNMYQAQLDYMEEINSSKRSVMQLSVN